MTHLILFFLLTTPAKPVRVGLIAMPKENIQMPTEYGCPSGYTLRIFHPLLNGSIAGGWHLSPTPTLYLDERRPHHFACGRADVTDVQFDALYKGAKRQ